MKRKVYQIWMDLILVIAFLAISWPIWDTHAANLPEVITINDYNSLGVFIPEANQKLIFQAEELNSFVLIVHNYANRTKKGNLILRYDRASTLNYRDLLITIDGTTKSLREFLMTSDKYSYIFIINEFTLPRNSNKEYNISLSMNERLEEKIDGKTFRLEFDAIRAN